MEGGEELWPDANCLRAGVLCIEPVSAQLVMVGSPNRRKEAMLNAGIHTNALSKACPHCQSHTCMHSNIREDIHDE